ncbi:hypothetical protein BBO_05319 [Beauveria brongniartii RCEF 3172]|uniref:Uncharacterized protein n=1 Tax=Beauveria brongniartii RCEF 3172 TaxID=1081107 RepID=A0A167D5D6_9HYPO|nr:hypothetical protein BBO_05319 [Beauveria brongniartii RCEF 3172]
MAHLIKEAKLFNVVLSHHPDDTEMSQFTPERETTEYGGSLTLRCPRCKTFPIPRRPAASTLDLALALEAASCSSVTPAHAMFLFTSPLGGGVQLGRRRRAASLAAVPRDAGKKVYAALRADGLQDEGVSEATLATLATESPTYGLADQQMRDWCFACDPAKYIKECYESTQRLPPTIRHCAASAGFSL